MSNRGRGRAGQQPATRGDGGRGRGQERGQGAGRGGGRGAQRGGFGERGQQSQTGQAAPGATMGRGQGGNFHGGPPSGQSRGRGFVGGFVGPRGPPPYHATLPNIFNPQPGVPLSVDARISDSDSLIQLLGASKRNAERPPRPGYGTLGRAIVLRANFFPVDISATVWYQYTVKINPEPTGMKGWVKRRILELFKDSPEAALYRDHIVHDGAAKLISARKLPNPLSGTIRYFEDGDDKGVQQTSRKYTVTIEYAKDLRTDVLDKQIAASRQPTEDLDDLVSAMNLILQRQASQTGFRFGRNRYFFSDDEKGQLGPKLWALMGFYSSVRLTYKQLMVNVNVCMTAFHEPGSLLNAWRAFNSASMGASPQDFLSGARISTKHLGYKRVYTVKNINGNPNAQTATIDNADFGGVITIEQYFARKFQITLTEPALFLVDVGGPLKPTFLPMEICQIERGSPYLGKLSGTETSDMLKFASRRPGVNAHLIRNRGLAKLGYNTGGTLLDEFGIKVSTEMTTIPARELPYPGITYKQGRPNVNNGGWNILNVKFHVGGNMANWKVMVVKEERGGLTGKDDPRLTGLLGAFQRKCSSSGITVPAGDPEIQLTPPLPSLQSDHMRSRALRLVEETMEGLCAKSKPSILVVLLGDRDDFIYPRIKQLGAVKFGVRTQCMLLRNALKDERRQDQYLSNVALKVNSKLGGINHRLDTQSMAWLHKKKTMMVGIDVTHPGPTSAAGTPSIAAVVASVDSDFVQFPASVRLQKSKQEGIAQLEHMMLERLGAYRKKSKALPEKVLVFRDGVSESQYDAVIMHELPQILAAFKKIDAKNPKYAPKLSIIICGKRHHARSFATSEQNADRTGNTRPGTIVDKGITAVFEYDFYLQAHAGLQGTVRPTHYVIIYDENNPGADEIQQGIHTTSYLYARATKAVSLIPPAYYADVVCEQARYWIHGFLNLGRAAGYTPAGGAGAAAGNQGPAAADRRKAAEARVYALAEQMWGNGLHENLKDTMWYL